VLFNNNCCCCCVDFCADDTEDDDFCADFLLVADCNNNRWAGNGVLLLLDSLVPNVRCFLTGVRAVAAAASVLFRRFSVNKFIVLAMIYYYLSQHNLSTSLPTNSIIRRLLFRISILL